MNNKDLLTDQFLQDEEDDYGYGGPVPVEDESDNEERASSDIGAEDGEERYAATDDPATFDYAELWDIWLAIVLY